ncbi:hypothetical protein [Flammeovirga aprica]|uniref:Alpha-galactosidase n=1 Tax=Flammeovirga aprica JL-4 TaxID=694437 RepID=A0A7X9RWW7_9BACT|nr:hypothetical protein [Flammeovirga aprica]NME70215.1 hypothetical protein [Flammeovirga aprica JL-4]
MKNKQFYLILVAVIITIITAYNTLETKTSIIENNLIKVVFNTDEGHYDIIDKAKDKRIVEKAYVEVNHFISTTYTTHKTTLKALKDELGEGQKLTVTSSRKDYPDLILEISLYNNKSYVVLNTGVVNHSDQKIRINKMSPLQKGVAYNKTKFESYFAIDGYSGGSLGWEWPGHGHTTAVHTQSLSCENNLMLTFGETIEEKNTLVMGGLTYKEFAKKAEAIKYVDHISLSLWCQDGVGKVVDTHSTYIPNEKFYLDFNLKNPFEALEKYANTVKVAQQVKLNHYTFPTLCLWYTHTNNTNDGVKQLDTAVEKGLLNYASMGIRIVPDNYKENNINGWFDDEHWQKYGFYTAPYETSEKFAKAIIDRGGIPFQYFQSTKTSTDYSEKYPEQCLFNDGSKKTGNLGPDWNIIGNGNYDLTDKDFEKHIKSSYAHLKKAGFQGLMVDYPHLSWHEDGGFDDEYTTTAGFHRKYFELAYNGLGKENSYVHERMRDSDVTLGVVSSKRTEGDTWSITPSMIKHTALRWYKNRVLVNWDMDAKDYTKVKTKNRDGIRTMFTMTYVASGRLLLGHSLYEMPDSVVYDLSRTLPYQSIPQTARPLDAFDLQKFCPQVYDYKVDKDWHQLTFFNDNPRRPTTISVDFLQNASFSGLDLEEEKQYYIYDFWNDQYIGKQKGDSELKQVLRPGESRMMSIHAEEDHPQFISTNRHIMQGMLDVKACAWNANENSLSGISAVVANDPYELVIAKNSHKGLAIEVSEGTAKWVDINKEIAKVVINSPSNAEIKWKVKFHENPRNMK